MKLFGFDIETNGRVYGPRKDTFLMAGCLEDEVKEGDEVLDMGAGTGVLALVAAKEVSDVLGVDVEEGAVRLAGENARKNFVDNVEFRVSNFFDSVDRDDFDLIVFNPPYIPGDERERKLEGSEQWFGGENGREVIEEFALRVGKYMDEGGRILLLISSTTGLEETREIFEDLKFETEILERKKLPWETLFVLRMERT